MLLLSILGLSRYPNMRILLISDLSWDEDTYKLLKQKLLSLKLALVLVAGDLFNSPLADAWEQVHTFLDFLERKKIKCFVVRGNWDESEDFDNFVESTRELQYTEEISGRMVEFEGLRILGIPYAMTEDLKVARQLPTIFPEKMDIVLTHALFRNRIWLFDLNTKYIITGHFDSQLCQIRDKIFISFYTFPHDYALLDYMPSNQTVTYYGGVARGKLREVNSVARIKKGTLIWTTKSLNSSNHEGLGVAPIIRRFTDNYASSIESLMSAKELADRNGSDRKEIVEELLLQGIPKSHINDYIRTAPKGGTKAPKR